MKATDITKVKYHKHAGFKFDWQQDYLWNKKIFKKKNCSEVAP